MWVPSAVCRFHLLITSMLYVVRNNMLFWTAYYYKPARDRWKTRGSFTVANFVTMVLYSFVTVTAMCLCKCKNEIWTNKGFPFFIFSPEVQDLGRNIKYLVKFMDKKSDILLKPLIFFFVKSRYSWIRMLSHNKVCLGLGVILSLHQYQLEIHCSR